ncbi:hypothetical protein [Reyranella sp.]|uniref:hypothetical protein n=1 Tax=Reyranella sp. TaxID=1929291 RepID=UPI0027208017|nr:hypothetical protein [Reyranella sp.]MDO8975787.1 hypothetical protein [Reyranella sp.]
MLNRTAVLCIIGLVPTASLAQMPDPQILGVQSGCFIRGDQAYNVLVKVGPNVGHYRFIFSEATTQQVAQDRTLGLIHPNTEVPFRLANAGNYRLIVKWAPQISNQSSAMAGSLIAVKPVVTMMVNGQQTCREASPLGQPGGPRPTPR